MFLETNHTRSEGQSGGAGNKGKAHTAEEARGGSLSLDSLTELSEEAAEVCVGQDRGVWAGVEVCGWGHVYCVNVISFTQRKQCVLSHLISGSSTILACFPHRLLFAELTVTSGPLLQLCPLPPPPVPE